MQTFGILINSAGNIKDTKMVYRCKVIEDTCSELSRALDPTKQRASHLLRQPTTLGGGAENSNESPVTVALLNFEPVLAKSHPKQRT